MTYSLQNIPSKTICWNIKYTQEENWKKSEKLLFRELFLRQALKLLGKGVIVENAGKKSNRGKKISFRGRRP